MESFTYTSSPSRVIFGYGASSKLPDELSRQGLRAALIISTPYQTAEANKIRDLLDLNAVGVFSEAAMHTPTDITEMALEVARRLEADCVVSVGGGSTTGLGKAISIRTSLPHICIPTTYAGSEMTPILGETTNGLKTTRRDPKILPAMVIYDIDLTVTLPQGLSATSGVNAIAHAVEALYAPDTNPIIRLLAKEGIRALAESLPAIVKDGSDISARSKALYGAWLCGQCLGSTAMSLHHNLCHVVGGSFNLPHAETHTILLPHTMAYNSPAVPVARRDLAEVLPGANGDPIKGLNSLLDRLGVKRALKDYGLKEEDIDRAATIAVKNQYSNPRNVEEESIRELIRRAWAGEPARSDL
ncbi:maleylacetate reductase [Penicillium subrubescens]|uniref:Maleylacetate reductase n=1 Tax=Penicillium subrubescens TaxID=1316194 RepID=A0A1Q5U2M9_9EURO|nr:maleylacetate reductase [Penicillium subrubescens]KAJ5904885.1 maleylacetate reductase [Penicillium subrubescens]OKP06717.1 Maleylacetate reductase [Penicillium subrubescens]